MVGRGGIYGDLHGDGQPVAMTALAQSEKRNRLAEAMHRLLDNLRPFMRAYAKRRDEQENLPDLDLVWVSAVDGGPEIAILDAIRSAPELWVSAVPDVCCIVPRKMLADHAGADVADYLAQHGAALVENYAARERHKQQSHSAR